MMVALALGTAQFGMDYGIANTTGRPSLATVADILALAQQTGIETLDTAAVYGDSEAVLGRVGVEGRRVITKLPAVPDNVSDLAGWMERQVTGSLKRLGIDQLHGLLLHTPVQMHGPRAGAISRALDSTIAAGVVERVGVSIQHPDHDLPAVLRHMVPGLIQSPFNLLDQALVANGWAARLRANGCEVHTRSAMLQGLLLMDAAQRPVWFDRWSAHWHVWHTWLSQTKQSATEACLRFVRSQADIDACIVGVDSPAQLQALLNIDTAVLPSQPEWPAPADIDLITPSRWKLT